MNLLILDISWIYLLPREYQTTHGVVMNPCTTAFLYWCNYVSTNPPSKMSKHSSSQHIPMYSYNIDVIIYPYWTHTTLEVCIGTIVMYFCKNILNPHLELILQSPAKRMSNQPRLNDNFSKLLAEEYSPRGWKVPCQPKQNMFEEVDIGFRLMEGRILWSLQANLHRMTFTNGSHDPWSLHHGEDELNHTGTCGQYSTKIEAFHILRF